MQSGSIWYLNGEDSQGLSYEREVRPNGLTEHKHFLSAGGMVFALQVTRTLTSGTSTTAATATLSYFHHDHLGSIAAVSNAQGVITERLAYDPWGRRRFASGLPDTLDSISGLATDRGYTMHEHLDEMGIIHMNGRVFDPLIGRFMSADPFIQAPGNLQSYNRYSYVMNNPLAFTDPSGYFSFRKIFRGLAKIFSPVIAFLPPKIASPLINVISVATCGPWAPACAGAGQAALAYYHGASSSQALRIGAQAGVSAFLFQQAGGVGEANSFARYAAHAGAGCISAAMGGESCGRGALSAVAGKWATNATSGLGDGFGAEVARFTAAVVAGGVASEIAGGKFANGAETAAYGYLFNYALTRNYQINQNVERRYSLDLFSSTGEAELAEMKPIFKRLTGWIGRILGAAETAVEHTISPSVGTHELSTRAERMSAAGLDSSIKTIVKDLGLSTGFSSLSTSQAELLVQTIDQKLPKFRELYGESASDMLNRLNKK
jgi:RHS repeat-associated protein